MNTIRITILLFLTTALSFGQNTTYWQQSAEYTMSIDMDVTTNKLQGTQKVVYINNSPDTLTKVYYHLYFNAFQPGSMMDIRSLNISDPDRRVGSRISKLKDDEIGYQHILSLKQDGKKVANNVQGTILEVVLNKPILPGKKSTLEMEFEAQVPIQIRRSGRDNAEGIRYSMAQWYPKVAEYDYLGWHTNPYIGREFHGIWSNFDVKISIDSAYTIGGTGYLQNADEIGHGYAKDNSKVNKKNAKNTWHFKAPMVHDFMWAADPDYKHVTAQVPNGPMMHFFYEETEENKEAWAKLPEYMVKAMTFMNKEFGVYPYEQYSFIQGGDGGMEYPMATLITGNRSFTSLLGVSVHEMIHSWYQGVLANNESLNEWMDEGFTSYASDITMHYLLPDDPSQADVYGGSIRSYVGMATSGVEEPLTTHADHYHTNRSYGRNAYSKGAVFLIGLNYILGTDTFMKGMRRYYNEWKFKHPTPINVIRAMEKVSDLQLDWYLEDFVYTTDQIDYSIKTIAGNGDKTYITLERQGEMIMPIDLEVTYKDGSKEMVYIPLRIMRGSKPAENKEMQRTTAEAWPWTYPTYTFELNKNSSEISKVEIDPSGRLADVDKSDNVIDFTAIKPFTDPTK
ncbi:M1 family metallopeptidase [Fulvivirga sp.]|uniref:M1 family metallopeptidase n=1 Tax=Fulvivirga sp. TaxID=1931237 RepID=UPI0032EED574